MKSALVFLAIVALSHGIPMSMNPSGRIVNGEDAKEGEFPYQISLQTMGGFHFCGGSILNENYVITAAHCVRGQSESGIRVIADTLYVNKPTSVHPVRKIISHAGYNPQDSYINDIALLKVSKKFVVSKTVAFVTLPVNNEEVPDDAVATVSGWGRLRENGETPFKLQRVDIAITNQDYCRKVYEDFTMNVHATQICAHNANVMAGSCHGDSGGPLTVEGKLTGLVSWAYGCASTKYPTVYTRVAKYIDWIETNAV